MSVELVAALQRLEKAIHDLPDACLSGRRDGPLVKHLKPPTDKETHEDVFPISPDGVYATFNGPWERVFQQLAPDADRTAQFQLVTRGKHGLPLALAWVTHYARLASESEQFLICLRGVNYIESIRTKN
jgi:hypothetical protein